VLEYTNAEWWKGRSEATGAEGIFPRKLRARRREAAARAARQAELAGRAAGGQPVVARKGKSTGRKMAGILGMRVVRGAVSTFLQ